MATVAFLPPFFFSDAANPGKEAADASPASSSSSSSSSSASFLATSASTPFPDFLDAYSARQKNAMIVDATTNSPPATMTLARA